MIITIRKYRYTEAERHNRYDPGIWTPLGPSIEKTYPSTVHKMDDRHSRNEFGGSLPLTELDAHTLHYQPRKGKRSDSGG